MRDDAKFHRRQSDFLKNASTIGYGLYIARPGDWVAWTVPDGDRQQFGRMLGTVDAPELGETQAIKGWLVVLAISPGVPSHAYERWINPDWVTECRSPDVEDSSGFRTSFTDFWKFMCDPNLHKKGTPEQLIRLAEYGSLDANYIHHADEALARIKQRDRDRKKETDDDWECVLGVRGTVCGGRSVAHPRVEGLPAVQPVRERSAGGGSPTRGARRRRGQTRKEQVMAKTVEDVLVWDAENGFPQRPGTVWAQRLEYPHACQHCGRPYNDHGGGGVAYVCPAPKDAWATYWREQNLKSVAGCIALFARDLQRFSPEDQARILDELQRVNKAERST